MEPLDETRILTGALWFVGICLAGHQCLPHLLCGLGLDFYRSEDYGEPADLGPDGKGPVYADLHRQLVDLGFVPLGIHRDVTVARRGPEEYVYFCKGEMAMASVYRALRGDPRVVLKTIFDTGAIARTPNFGSALAERTGDYLCTPVPTTSVRQVLARHRESVEVFRRRGDRPLDLGHLEAIGEAERTLFFNPTLRRCYQTASGVLFASHLFMVGAVTVFISITLADVVPGVHLPLALTLAAGGSLVVTTVTERRIAASLSEEQRQADDSPVE